MPQIQKYRVDTDKGSFEVEVETPEAPFTGSYGLMADAASPNKEPDTFAGGFLNKIGLSGRNPLLAGAAQPKNVGDFLSLLIPSQVEGVAKTAAQYGRAIKQGVSEAPMTAKGLLSVPGRAFDALKADMPTARAATADAAKAAAMPRQMGPLTSESVGGSMPNLVPRTPNPRMTPRLVKSPATTLEEELIRSLSEGPTDARMTSLPPEQTITSGGPTKQSGKFGKSGNMGQAGGYTSGRPATPAVDWEAEAENVSRNAPFGEGSIIPSNVKPTELSDVSPASSRAMKDIVERRQVNKGPMPGMTDRRTAELLDKFGGRGGPTSDAGGAGNIPAAEVANMRRHYGARDAAKMLGITEDDVRRLAPGPSRTPIVAENRIREALAKAKKP